MQLQLKSKLLITFIILSTWLCASKYPSQHFTIREGLPSNAVYCVFKDSKGIIWIGTDAGLVKYDGFNFQTFTKKNGLIGNFIRDIKEDENGHLWIACYGDGLSKFNGNQFKNYSTKNGLIHNEIRCLYFDKKQNLCIGTERGLSIWNGKKFMNFLTKSFDGYNRFQVMQFWEERDKLYFLSRTHGYYEVNKKGNKLICDSIGKNYSQLTFIRLKNEKLYSFTDGLFSDKTNDRFPLNVSKHHKLSSDIVWDFEKIGSACYFASNCIFCNQGGLLKYEYGKLRNVSENYNIDSKQIWSLYFDKSAGKLWVSSLDKGFYVIDLKPKIAFFEFSNWLDFRNCSAGIIASKTTLQLNSSGKIIDKKDFLNFAKVSQQNFVKIIESKSFCLDDFSLLLNLPFEIRAWKVTTKQIYVSTNIGFFELTKQGAFISYFPGETNLFLIRKNDVVFYVPNGKFIRLKKIKNKWHFFELEIDNELQPKNINEIAHFRGETYFASDLYGLYSMKDNQTGLRHHQESALKGLKIKGLCSDNKKTLFLATNENEILAFNEELGKLKLKYKLDSENFIGESILNIKFDNDVLIILTNRGLNLIKGKENIFINGEQGLNIKDIAKIFVENNQLFIRTSLGYYEIKISDFFNSENEKSIISIAHILIQGKAESISEHGILNLPYFQNNLDLNLNKIKLYNAKKVELSYSFDRKNWSEIHGNTIRLKELASGNYQLFVRQKNLFSGNIIVYPLLKFSIAEPFWKTSWFLFLIALIFITSVYFVYSFNIKRITAREKQKAELLKRIAETKLEALQSQMNPHFIFNSLTSIHNYIIKSDVDNALLHMDKFAKLTRQTLEFSSRMQITLIEELEYLSNFIALENMRFGNRVGVSINAGELDTTKILIPPLLIQPLIENSFEHGFTDRDKKYNLALSFSVAKNQLIVRLSDDGIGFHASTVHPESKALSIIRERLLLIDSTLEGDFSINCENNQTLIRFVLPLVTI